MELNKLSHRVQSRAWMTNAILLILGFGLLAVTRQLTVEFHHYEIGFSGVAGWSVVLFGLAAMVILKLPSNRFTLLVVIAFGIAFRLATLFPGPFMSTDIYRYVWDGMVQHAHVSPYRYVPADPALAFLRHSHPDIFEHINRRNYAHTIYPPISQVLFYLVTSINDSVTFMKLAMILFEGVTVYALMELLRALGRRREEILLYAWCPLVIWEIGSSGHIDSAAMAFIALALLARFRHKPLATGLFLGAAILIKFYPLVLLPALWQRKSAKMPAALVTLVVVSYACYASAGKLVFGFLGGYAQEEGLETGTRYFFLELARRAPGLEHLSAGFYLGATLLGFSGLALWCWHTANRTAASFKPSFWTRTFDLPKQAQFLPGALFLSFAMMLVFSPHYPWYVVWLIPFCVLLPNLTVFAYALGLFYLSTTSLGAGTLESQYRLNCVLYLGVLLVLVFELSFRIWRDRNARLSEAAT